MLVVNSERDGRILVILEGLDHLGEPAGELDVDWVDGRGGDLDQDVIWSGDLGDSEVVDNSVVFWLCPL